MLTIFRGAGAGRRIAAQVVAGVGVLVHRRERVAEGAARTGKAGVLATLAAAKVLVAAAYRAIPGPDGECERESGRERGVGKCKRLLLEWHSLR